MAAIHLEATYPAPARRVFDVLTDEAFLVAYAHEVGALAHRVGVERAAAAADEVRTRVAMTVPTAGSPGGFKRLVTATIDLTEVRTWHRMRRRAGGRGGLGGRVSAQPRRQSARGTRRRTRRRAAPATARFGVDGNVNVERPAAW